MARRRMISQDLISDEHFNSISIEAQNIFIRMLSVSDDCGVVPASLYKLNVLINTPKKIFSKLEAVLSEFVKSGLGFLFIYREERFFAFKPSSFEDYQSYILKKATKSEYLRIPKKEFEELSKNFQELPRTSLRIIESAVSTVESRKQKVESKEQKVESNKNLAPEYYMSIFNIFLPENLLTDWKNYLDYCYERGDIKLNRSTITAQAKFLRDHLSDAKEIIANSIQNNWKGLFEVKRNGKSKSTGATADELAKIATERELRNRVQQD